MATPLAAHSSVASGQDDYLTLAVAMALSLQVVVLVPLLLLLQALQDELLLDELLLVPLLVAEVALTRAVRPIAQNWGRP